MKFDEKRWRCLAENKPDELHSYIPQSSISELFDEIERLEHEIAKCKEANKDVQSRLDDYRQDYEKVVNDLCPTDERHCGCVPILRRENRLISEELADAKDELKHRRDALIDAQRIYNKANEQKVHYLSALQFIASFVNAKDKTTVDDLIAIASKEIDAEGDQIVDACNYWVSKLRDAEDELQDAQLKPKAVSAGKVSVDVKPVQRPADPSLEEDEFDTMPIEKINQYLREHGYDPEKVGLRGKILVEALTKNIIAREIIQRFLNKEGGCRFCEYDKYLPLDAPKNGHEENCLYLAARAYLDNDTSTVVKRDLSDAEIEELGAQEAEKRGDK